MAKNTIRDAQRFVREVIEAIDEKSIDVLEGTAKRTRDVIAIRTSKGQTGSGEKMKAYTPAYAKSKSKTGRKGEEVNLRFSGSMMQSMTIEKRGSNEVVLTFPAGQQTKAAINDKLREFFNIDEETANKIIDREKEDWFKRNIKNK